MRQSVVSIVFMFAVLAVPAAAAVPNLPPIPTRKIAPFKVTEVSATNLDLSPDGRTVIFEMLGGLWRLPREGGQAKRLLDGPAVDRQPRFSPNGRKIAFVSDRSGTQNIWMMELSSGQLTQLTFEDPLQPKIFSFISPNWSPDGKSIVVTLGLQPHYLTGDTIALALIDVAKRKVTTLVDTEGKPVHGREAQFVTTDELVYAVTGEVGGEQRLGGDVSSLPLWQLFRYSLSSRTVRQDAQRPMGAISPVVARDGTAMIYAARELGKDRVVTGLRLHNWDQLEDRWLMAPIEQDKQELRGMDPLVPIGAFSSDGRHYIVGLGAGIGEIDVATGAVRTIPFKATVAIEAGKLTQFPLSLPSAETVTPTSVTSPAISPDGKRVAYVAFQRIWVQNISGGNPVRLTDDAELGFSEFDPDWSPDGQTILFAGQSANYMGSLYTAPSSGQTRARRMACPNAYYSTPIFNAAGNTIFALRGEAANRARSGLSEFYQDIIRLSGDGDCPKAEKIGRIENASQAYIRVNTGLSETISYYDKSIGLLELDPADGTTRLLMPPVSVENAGQQREMRVRDIIRRPNAPGEALMVYGGDDSTGSAQYVRHIDLKSASDGSVDASEVRRQLAEAVRGARPERNITTAAGGFMPGWLPDGSRAYYALGSYMVTKTPGSRDVSELQLAPRMPRKTDLADFQITGAVTYTMAGGYPSESGMNASRSPILVSSGRFASATGNITANTIDLTGFYITPGFIDTHCHMAGNYPQRGVSFDHMWALRAYLAYGVTTCLDPFGPFSQYSVIDSQRTGASIGARLITTGPGVHLPDPVFNLSDARDLVRRYSHFYEMPVMKIWSLTPRLRERWLFQAAAEQNVSTMVEVNDLAYDISVAYDGGGRLAHGFPGVAVHEDLINLFSRSGTGVDYQFASLSAVRPSNRTWFRTQENLLDDPKARTFVDQHWLEYSAIRWLYVAPQAQTYMQVAKVVGEMQKGGITVGLGGHGEMPGPGAAWEVRSLGSGTTAHQALWTATASSARSIGLEKELGSIEQGKRADFLIFADDPVKDLSNLNSLRYVVQDGIIYDADSLEVVPPGQLAR